MKLKLDENFGTRTQHLFRNAGHEVYTVRDQGLQGCSDTHLYALCCSENCCLVTLDLDFSDVLRFPPKETNGIVVIRVPQNPSVTLLEQMVSQFLQALLDMTVERKLWVVEIGRIRIHQEEIEEREEK